MTPWWGEREKKARISAGICMWNMRLVPPWGRGGEGWWIATREETPLRDDEPGNVTRFRNIERKMPKMGGWMAVFFMNSGCELPLRCSGRKGHCVRKNYSERHVMAAWKEIVVRLHAAAGGFSSNHSFRLALRGIRGCLKGHLQSWELPRKIRICTMLTTDMIWGVFICVFLDLSTWKIIREKKKIPDLLGGIIAAFLCISFRVGIDKNGESSSALSQSLAVSISCYIYCVDKTSSLAMKNNSRTISFTLL